MSEYDADAYDALWKRVEREARHLQVIDRCFQTRRASDSEAFNGTTARRVSTKSSIQFLIQGMLCTDLLFTEILELPVKKLFRVSMKVLKVKRKRTS